MEEGMGGGRNGVGEGRREGGRGANNKYHNRDSGFYFGVDWYSERTHTISLYVFNISATVKCDFILFQFFPNLDFGPFSDPLLLILCLVTATS